MLYWLYVSGQSSNITLSIRHMNKNSYNTDMGLSDDATVNILIDLAEKMGSMINETKEVRNEVHNINTSLNEKVTLLIEANRLKEKEQDDKINSIETLVKGITPLVTNLQPLSDVMSKGTLKVLGLIAAGIIAIFSFSGSSLTTLAINTVNDTTGVTELNKIVKKNSETLNRLITYLHLEKEVQK